MTKPEYPALPDTPDAIEERKRAFLQLLLNGGARNATRAAQMLGINPAVIRDWKQIDLEFKQAVEWAVRQARQDKIEAIEESMYRNAVENDNFQSQKFLLQAWAPDDYAPPKPEPVQAPQVQEASWREANRPKRLHELPMGEAPVPDDDRE